MIGVIYLFGYSCHQGEHWIQYKNLSRCNSRHRSGCEHSDCNRRQTLKIDMSCKPWFGCLALLTVLGLPSYIYSDLPTGCDPQASSCPSDSTCGTGNNCECNDGFKLNHDGDGCVAKVLKDGCDGDNGCTGLDHSVCTNSKCECETNYGEKNGVCTKAPPKSLTSKARVSAVVCSDGGAQCNTIDHAVCDVQTLKCKCKAGYIENKMDTSKCVKIIGGVCTGTSACDGDSNSVCKNDICECADNFGEKKNVCTATIDSKACTAQGTECSSLPHAECDTVAKKCRCSAGFKMNVDTCDANNAGISTTLSFAVLAIPVVLAMKEALENGL